MLRRLMMVLAASVVVTNAFGQVNGRQEDFGNQLADVLVTEGKKIQDIVAAQRKTAHDLQELLSPSVVADLQKVVPTGKGIGIQYGVALKEEDESRAVWGVQVVAVYRDSAAGRAGVKPGDWIAVIDSNALCNAVFFGQEVNTSEEKKKLAEEVNKKLKLLLDGATGLFAQAPKKFRLVVTRETTDLVFDLERGPIAPALAAAIDGNTPAYIRELVSQKAEVDKLVAELATEPSTFAEIDRRNTWIDERLAAYRKFLDEIEQLIASHQVPHPKSPK